MNAYAFPNLRSVLGTLGSDFLTLYLQRPHRPSAWLHSQVHHSETDLLQTALTICADLGCEMPPTFDDRLRSLLGSRPSGAQATALRLLQSPEIKVALSESRVSDLAATAMAARAFEWSDQQDIDALGDILALERLATAVSSATPTVEQEDLIIAIREAIRDFERHEYDQDSISDFMTLIDRCADRFGIVLTHVEFEVGGAAATWQRIVDDELLFEYCLTDDEDPYDREEDWQDYDDYRHAFEVAETDASDEAVDDLFSTLVDE